MHEGQLKTVSFLPDYAGVYPQMPYSAITEKEYEEATMTLFKVDLDQIYDGTTAALDAVGEAYCTTSSCEVKEIVMSERN
jgi:ribonucleoside-triphosphate reductase